jgi:flavin-dependent dehydrogenase
MGNPSGTYDVIVAGGGPAGSSAAIHLASNNLRVLLVEQKKFPRPKLCGEFISPECFNHFKKLGVDVDMLASNPAFLTATNFYSQAGTKISVPSRWLGPVAALGLSRAVMDHHLLKRAIAVGVDVLQESTVTSLVRNEDEVIGVVVRAGSKHTEFRSSVTIDATGRSRALSRRLGNSRTSLYSKARWVAFKAHLANTTADANTCEIYSYPSGYGGVSTIESGVSNLCFIVDAAEVRKYHSDPDQIMRKCVMTNRRAAYSLSSARVVTDWLSVALGNFGRFKPNPAKGLFAIGDSAAFIDPFTGSGMLMALESGALLSQTIVRHRDKLCDPAQHTGIAHDYLKAYDRSFNSRLRVCEMLRRVAFNPKLAQTTIRVCSVSDRLRSWLARSTRSRLDKGLSVAPK